MQKDYLTEEMRPYLDSLPVGFAIYQVDESSYDILSKLSLVYSNAEYESKRNCIWNTEWAKKCYQSAFSRERFEYTACDRGSGQTLKVLIYQQSYGYCAVVVCGKVTKR